MDSTSKILLVVGVGAVAYFGFKAVTAATAARPAVPNAAIQSPTGNGQPTGATRPTSLDQFTQYGTALGSGVGAVVDIYNKIWGS